MRKSLFAIGLLAAVGSVQAQNVLLHVDNTANAYIGDGTLVYSGGGVQTKGNGILDIHGNFMIEGSGSDVLKTITTGDGDKTDGGNIVLRLNDPSSSKSTYGQLYINGLSQSNITGIVSKEFLEKKHGAGTYFQQMAIPFFGKAMSTLSTEFNKTFNNQRYLNPITKWDNTNAVAHHFTNLSATTSDPAGYYMLKSVNNDLNTETPPSTLPTISPTTTGSVYTVQGKPNANFDGPVTLQNAGNVNFGSGGNNRNMYNEKYNTYLDDGFELTVAGVTTAWLGNFGKNIYQFGNPFLTNLDLSKIAVSENTGTGDGNHITNLWGIEYNPGTVITLPNGSTYATGALNLTVDPETGIAVGDDLLVIKPMQTFKIKLRDNSSQTLDFNTLRRFASTARTANTVYNVACRNSTSKNRGTIKQLAVIGLDSSGKEVSRTYYAVSPTFTTGHQNLGSTSVQVSAGTNVIGTFEEASNGGYDNNNTNYWLYINEANEVNFLGKNVKLANYNLNVVKSYKFEIKENTELIPDGAHELSSGIGFFYKANNGNVVAIKQGDVLPATTSESDLFYGAPDSQSNLAVKKDEVKVSRTLVIYDPSKTNYIVRFDPNWKKADIEVYDMSGKLVISKKAVDASADFVIELSNSLRNSYIVKVVSDKGEIVNTKILK